jgi:hypothetical protein
LLLILFVAKGTYSGDFGHAKNLNLTLVGAGIGLTTFVGNFGIQPVVTVFSGASLTVTDVSFANQTQPVRLKIFLSFVCVFFFPFRLERFLCKTEGLLHVRNLVFFALVDRK